MNILLDFLVRMNHQSSQKVIQGLGVCTLASLALGSLSQTALADLTITPTTNATAIGSQLTGSNVTISGVTINQGNTGGQTGTFTGGSTGTAGPLLGIENGVTLVTGDATTADGPNRFSNRSTGNETGPTSSSLATVDSGTQYDTVTLEFNVVPSGNTLSMEFLFASEEYNEFVCTRFNDAMGIFVSGPGITGEVNIARLDQTLAGFSINEINRGVAGAAASNFPAPCNLSNSQFFVNNIENYNETISTTNNATPLSTQSSYTNVEYDGFTKPLAASLAVQPNQTYTIKVVTADIGDPLWDGGVFVDGVNSYNLDYGDAPNSYKTSTINQAIQLPGPARHSVPLNPNVYLGALPPDVEVNGTPATSPNPADGDDNTGDDEDAFGNTLKIPSGITSHLISGIPLRNTSGQTAKLMGWIDFNLDGDFLDPGEQATVNVAPNQTTAALSWSGFPRIVAGNTYARFRITTDASLISSPNSAGLATNGEVEDYQVEIAKYDYGDAPDAATGTGTGNYQTTAADSGASQAVINTPGQILKLGGNLDHDDGSLQNTAADADDTNGNPDDEDGVSSFPSLTTVSNQTYTVPVTVSNNVTSKDAFLVGYIDFNKDGDFLDTGEKSTTVTVPTSSTNPRTVNITFTTPTGMTAGNTYARFRLGQVQATAELSTGASNITDYGEIEDYPMAIAVPSLSLPATPTNVCTTNWYRWQQPYNDIPLPGPPGRFNPTTLGFTKVPTSAGANTWYNAPSSPNLTQLNQPFSYTLPNDNTNNTSEAFYGVTYLERIPGETISLDLVDTLTNEGHVFAAFDSAGNLVGRFPSVSRVTTGGKYYIGSDSAFNATTIPHDSESITQLSAWSQAVNLPGEPFTFTVPADGKVYIHYIVTDENLRFTPIKTQNSLCRQDYSDAPTSGTAPNGTGTNNYGVAIHNIVPTLKLGANIDSEATSLASATANGDDTNGTPDDEEGVTLPNLTAGATSYSIPAANINITNTSGSTATLHAWIDFNKNGTFESSEYTSTTVNTGTNGGNPTANLTWSSLSVGTTGNTYARFRLTNDASINSNTPGGAANNGEVEDYQIAIAPRPELLLVKRITAINPGQPGKEIQFSNFVNDPTVSDNHPLWPNSNIYLRGVIDAGKVKPDDEVEYTVYFLSSGDVNAKEVKICDVVPDHMTFVKNTYGVELGIGLGFDPTVLPTDSNLQLSNLLNDDQGDFYGPGTAPPKDLCKKATSANTLVNINGTNNDNGAVVVKLQNLPKATAPGVPTDSYGFIRFRAKVK